MEMSMTFGIIDVGTNSIHLLIVRTGRHGTWRVILKQQELARLGRGGLTSGRLTPRSMTRAFGVLRRYAQALKRHHVDYVDAVATSAVRGAHNGPAFTRRIRTQLGLPLRVISGREEARLIYLGVLQARRFRGTALIITIGGGSAQVIYGRDARVRYATSLPLGAARLSQRFIRHDPPAPDEVAALEAYVHRAWVPIARTVRRYRRPQVFGSSATIRQLMMAARLRAHGRVPKHLDRISVTQAGLRRLVDWLAQSTSKERMSLDGLDPRRHDLALTTGITLLAWMEACGVTALPFAPGSLREGLVGTLLSRHAQHRAGGPSRLATTAFEHTQGR